MSNYIEFTTHHNERAFGNPVHNGKRPKRYRDVQGVRVDGDPVDFVDDTIPERLQRYFVESRSLRRRRIVNDCVAFVAVMNSIEIEDRHHNPFRNFDETTTIDLTDFQPDEERVPLVLVQGFHDGVKLPRHIVLPAHLTTGQNYLHKLGDKGPLCMSDLDDALSIMGCSSAHPAS
jgi:hypothetical protein